MLIVGVVILALVVGGYLLMNNQNKNTAITPQATNDTQMTTSQEDVATSDESQLDAMEAEETNVKEFTVNGGNFTFDPAEITVKKGDTVRIVFNNKEGFHDWVLDEFNAKTKQLDAGGSETIEFVADQAGTFEYYCSVGQHRQMGMVGNLIVEE